MKNVDTRNTKLVTVAGSGAITELGNISAPIMFPTRLPISKVTRMVSNGRVVFEHDPNNTDKKIRLTVSNCREKNFVTEKPAEKNPAPQKTNPPANEKKDAGKQTNANAQSNKNDPKGDEKKSDSAKTPTEAPASDFSPKKD